MPTPLCRIGAFYDGSYFTYAQNHLCKDRHLGWLDFQAFQELVEQFVKKHEPSYSSHRVVYSAWFQGLFPTSQADDRQLANDRSRHSDLIHAGIEAKYVPMSQSSHEKGVDVALAVDALQLAIQDRIDVAALVTGDGDFVPLVRALMKHGVRAAAVYFHYQSPANKGFANERLLRACNYSLNVNQLENVSETRQAFQSLFRHNGHPKSPQPAHESTPSA